jgi:hypothetical protein
MKNVKWIEAIGLVDGDYRGYWQQRGCSDAAPCQTLARIDEPRDGDTRSAGVAHEICGIALATDRGISKVDVWLGPDDRTSRHASPATVALHPGPLELHLATARPWQICDQRPRLRRPGHAADRRAAAELS